MSEVSAREETFFLEIHRTTVASNVVAVALVVQTAVSGLSRVKVASDALAVVALRAVSVVLSVVVVSLQTFAVLVPSQSSVVALTVALEGSVFLVAELVELVVLAVTALTREAAQVSVAEVEGVAVPVLEALVYGVNFFFREHLQRKRHQLLSGSCRTMAEPFARVVTDEAADVSSESDVTDVWMVSTRSQK